MKRILVLFFVTTVLSAKGDTIDFWHVYYNNNLIGDFSETSGTPGHVNLVKLKANQIRPGDLLRIEYYGDVIRWDCPFPIVHADNDSAILLKGIDSTGRVMCSSSDGLAIKANDVKKIFIMIDRNSRKFKIDLFSLLIE